MLPGPARPQSEVAELERIWRVPTGLRALTAVNNTQIGVFYIGTALWFLALGGILALLMRLQLAVPNNTLIDQETYNQLFTMHGSMMMFLFAVPVVEAMGVMLLPQMLAARDLPFPRLSAFAFWAYFVGGNVFFLTLFLDLAPSGGWFMYPPLTSREFSPGANADFWLLGIGFIEISAIAGAIEIVVGILRTRAPGMTLGKMPVFAWTMLIFAGMIMFAFPALILATMMLELERAFQWPFFIAARGGDPVLWQHLFWFFGHPEVYIIFLPAAGMVSMILPTMARTPLVGYSLIVIALIATGFFSFGLWVHHMFATGIPSMSLGFFSAASMAVTIPSGIQVFAWIATIANGRLRVGAPPTLFVLGFLFIFVLGGLTGVMVAMVPFDWQVHDTYFVVAHFHYVLVGGMVFPLMAGLYYWTPAFSRYPLSDRIGRWAFALMFVGFNVAFFTMHFTGLMGMPRRVYTYPAEVGWDNLNLLSTVGAFILAAGVALVFFDLLRNFRISYDETPGNIWGAGTLEWLPNGTYSTRSIPLVTSREPIWDQPNLARDVEQGRYFLPNAPTGRRETLLTSPIEGRPQAVVLIPGPGWAHFLAAVFVALFFLSLTIEQVFLAALLAAGVIVSIVVWMWDMDPGPRYGVVDVNGGIKLPTYVTGPISHSWWAMIVLLLVAAALYLSWIFSYFYIWTVSPDVWPKGGWPELTWPLASAAALILSSGAMLIAGRMLARRAATALLIGLALLGLIAGFGVDMFSWWETGLRPSTTSYGALTFMNAFLLGELVIALSVMAVFAIARLMAGMIDPVRRVTFDNTALLWHFAVAQGLLGLLIVHGFPRLVG